MFVKVKIAIKYRLILVLLLAFAFSDSFSQVVVMFKGQIQNPNSDSLTIQQEIEWGTVVDLDVIKVDKDGKFNAKINVPNKGLYKVNDGKEVATVFFEHNGILSMYLETKLFDETIMFKGDGALESNYMAEKALMIEGMGNLTYYGYYASLGEKAFLNLNDSILGLHNALLDKYPKLDVELEFNERNFYKFDFISRIHNYPSMHHFVTGKKNSLSESYPDPFIGFDLNNERYLPIFNFRSCADDYISHLFLIESKTKKPDEMMYYIDKIHLANKNISNKQVMEEMVYYITRYNMKRSKDVDSCYNLFKSLVNKPEYLEDVKIQYDKLKLRAIWAPSPKFAFKDRNENIIHLDSLKGKLVYIDIWATWCGPCIKEIPSMKKLQDTLKEEDIVFVSICRQDTKERWMKALEKYSLGGIQLFAEEGENNFFEDYSSTGYPHYILVGKEGEIISPDAMRPGNPKLMELILGNL